MSDDDFHFEFGAEDMDFDRPLHIVMQDEDCIIGHLLPDDNGTTWMLGAYFINENESGPFNVELIEVPNFRLDPYANVMIVTNADEMRLTHLACQLNLGFINDTPFLCNSTRH
ncbi:hypothetical protein pEaSNUABM28_00218 [Erwinia phage pEa_SNUABM_28]|uniref:Uncharacterized protein n=2 Tax=Alexandravirus TaxID=2733088 RepID=A0AAE8XUV3_9CAUD|nr:hypothetical protein MPK63_gp215 [Erwinia phage pEa_SNUABM_22]YP_010299977.1 hypothetical protein MPK64_gp216 [Erwinia phage pEa_SNUABM_16]QZE58775.1 hypothetical protein pEaSNUABM28_00218 [Erwinia phage pEa_SNUABM_28]QZE59119.1 hypothetical protein pEaSNUABM18_00216 [Erwinia phage pEa_SNUABM_18]UAW96360.1 hypothetical protein pEaSNUABM16_00216 [Erwinia phage pEa_SNUABM_16]UAW96703.1 hypothetical protein pEaSNUABM22_00216 [Erwinia phage pEa_SNUABM_22]